MTAHADLAEVRAALALVAKATPGPWSSTTSPMSPAGGLMVFDIVSVRRPIATTCGDTDDAIEEAERNAAAIVALRNAAPAIAAAVEELTAARAEIAALRDLAGEAIETASEAPDGGDQVADYRERLASLNRQVCRLVSGHAIESDHLCQHHGADVAALAQVARYQAAAVAVATEIGGPLGPVDDDPEERAAAFVRFAEGLAGRVRERVEALEADLVRALHRERRVSDESDERLRRMAELLIKDANNE